MSQADLCLSCPLRLCYPRLRPPPSQPPQRRPRHRLRPRLAKSTSATSVARPKAPICAETRSVISAAGWLEKHGPSDASPLGVRHD